MSTRSGWRRGPRRPIERAHSLESLATICSAAVALAVLMLALAQNWNEHPLLALAACLCAVALAGTAGALAVGRARVRADAAAQRARLQAAYAQMADERLRAQRALARDLHDGMQQQLLAIAASFEAAKAKATEADAELLEVIIQARTSILHALSELRDFTTGVYPSILDAMGLSEAVQNIAEKLPVSIRMHITDRRFSSRIEYGLYLMISEALANIVKHANATRVTVDISVVEDMIQIEVTDDGIGGADPQAGGLTGLKQRAIELGGELTVYSPPGHGTAIRARIPCG